ncbi:hypothetical protein T484DRAFT_2272027 [Baffinella frigidus]|nr:hypothetical protein T484DRAFT_2272027 [Cryptophyta sp. CCMP2293]
MGNRQSLLNRSDSSAAEIQKLRQTCDQLWRQIQLVRPAGGGGSSGSPAGRSLPPGMSAGGGMGGGMGGGHRGGGMGGGGMPSPGLGSMSPGLSGMSPALNSMGGAHMSPGMAPMGGEDPRGMHGGMQGGVPNMGGRARGPPPMGAPPPMGGGYPGGGQMGMQGPGMKVERGVSGGYGGVAVPGLGGWDPVPSMQRQPSNDMYYEGGAGELRWAREDAQGGLGAMSQGDALGWMAPDFDLNELL